MLTELRVTVNVDQALQQIGEFSALFERLPECVAQDALQLCRGYLDRLPLDVVVRQDVAAPNADAASGLGYVVRLGPEFENLLAALGALEVEGVR